MRSDKFILNTILCCSMILNLSCKKEIKTVYQYPVGDSSRISITNVSPSISNLQFYLNDKFFSLPDSPLVFGKTATVTYIANPNSYRPDTILLPYFNIQSGYQQLAFTPDVNSNIISTINNNFEPGAAYSLFLTDTIIHGKVASVLLKDNIVKTDTTKSQIRFLNLCPDAPPLDVWAYPDAGYTGYKLFSACAYLPNDFNSFVNAQNFTVLSAGLYYFEATLSGTTNVVSGGYLFLPGQNAITIFTKGYLTGFGTSGLEVGVIQYKE